MKKATAALIVNPLTYNYLETFSSKSWERSLTVPDQVMPLSEVISRYTRGQAVPSLPGTYADIDLSPYDDFDKFQIIDLQRKLSHKARVLRADADSKKQALIDAKAKAVFDAAVLEKSNLLFKTSQNDKNPNS